MASRQANNFKQPVFNGAYGNKANASDGFSNLLSGGTGAAGDTYDFLNIPAGAKLVEGFIYTTQFTGTSTWAFGARYADGTSTGGTTGTAIFSTGLIATTGLAKTILLFKPFTNDADTIIYATFVSGPAHTANDDITLSLDYIAQGNK